MFNKLLKWRSLLNETRMNKLEVFQFWPNQNISKIPWTTRTTNENALRRMGTDIELLNTINVTKGGY